MERESMEFDVVIVGAGPSGLATACRLGQLAQDNEQELMICVVEKGADIGAHILSGAVFEPRALNELFPDWKDRGAPLNTKVTGDDVLLLKDENNHHRLPDFSVPKTFHNKGNYIASMGNLCRWMAEQAEQLGIEIFPGFAASEMLYNEDGSVAGIQTGDMGVAQDGSEKDGYMPGMELRAKYTLFAEGCRGHLGKELISKFELDKDSTPQHYGLGFKEIWDVPEDMHEPGKVVHTAGWPLTDSDATGGGYLYHAEDGQVYLGLIVDLNYANPYLNPFQEFQRFKTHPAIKQVIEDGKRVSYGARAIAKGGYYSLPKMTFPGGLLIGCNAGTLNFAKIKGNHTAMKSGMVAAECVFEQLKNGKANDDITLYKEAFEQSWVFDELYRSRNFGGAVHKLGTILGGAYNMVDQNWFGGKLPFKFKEWTPDYKATGKAENYTAIDYPKADNKLTFDRLSSVFLSNTNHAEDQPCHLKLGDANIPLEVNFPEFAEPAQRYCPAGVYEVVEEDGKQAFQINAQNCIHCKTCDIKDPSQNITWVVPEGGGGPTYPNM